MEYQTSLLRKVSSASAVKSVLNVADNLQLTLSPEPTAEEIRLNGAEQTCPQLINGYVFMHSHLIERIQAF